MGYVVHKIAVVAPDGWAPPDDDPNLTYWLLQMHAQKPFAVFPAGSDTYNEGEFLLYWTADAAGPMSVYAITAVDAVSAPGSILCTLAIADPVISAVIKMAAAGISEPVTFTS